MASNPKPYGNVSRIEVKRWEKWLRSEGFSGPFAGLKPTHECVKLLAKELKKDPPKILETHPRDQRTIAKALTRFGNRYRNAKIGLVNYNDIDLEKVILNSIHEVRHLQEMLFIGIPEYLRYLISECSTPGVLICSRDYVNVGKLSWYECNCEMMKEQNGTLCKRWVSCPYYSSRVKQFELHLRITDSGKVQIQLPSRNRFPNFEVIFPDLVNLRLYKEICRFEELGTIWFEKCLKLLLHIETQEKSGIAVRSQSSDHALIRVEYNRKLNREILEPALHAMEEWNRQSEIIQPWRRLIMN